MNIQGKMVMGIGQKRKENKCKTANKNHIKNPIINQIGLRGDVLYKLQNKT